MTVDHASRARTARATPASPVRRESINSDELRALVSQIAAHNDGPETFADAEATTQEVIDEYFLRERRRRESEYGSTPLDAAIISKLQNAEEHAHVTPFVADETPDSGRQARDSNERLSLAHNERSGDSHVDANAAGFAASAATKRGGG